ncbi:MAG: bifunctional phosphoribosylaminoimidazolecarboxamide formyltransferase/IMP cyclohydrolase [Bacteroidetes bacterium]|nr:bifunctional phosphoribosylaminoimidazolecarboxamide formyltransferase/IMP cyclohydrolase [Bacteroidota bacterium]
MKKISSALVSVFSKEGLDEMIKKLHRLGVTLYSTGGTYDFITGLGIPAVKVEDITSYPSILGGRVKTLHPKVFGGILARREHTGDQEQVKSYEIPWIDAVIVDLYPFEKTLEKTSVEEEIIEMIDIGGISLIRAAAKNFNDVVIVPSSAYYTDFIRLLDEKGGQTTPEDRKRYAAAAFAVSSAYDSLIFNYFNKELQIPSFRAFADGIQSLRYGENPHQKGVFYGHLDEVFTRLHGKEISYNNLLDLDAAIGLINEFEETAFAILKHNNVCGFACRPKLPDAWKDALAGDPVSAFGGVLITNSIIDADTAEEINKLFFEIILAEGYENKALEVLQAKKNRIILQKKKYPTSGFQYKSALGGVLWQEKDLKKETPEDLKAVTRKQPSKAEVDDLLFAGLLVKHTKSNAIVLAKNRQLLASGTGQTSRVDALKQAIAKAQSFGFDLRGAVMASDAFFPFADCVEIAHQAGITAVIQPGGSVRDEDSIRYCDEHEMAMVFTGYRHFKH